MTKNFTLVNCNKFNNSLNDTVYNINYWFTDEWNEKQICLATCYLYTDLSTNNLYLRTMTFKVKDENGKWNSLLAKNLIYTDIYNKNVSKHINFLKKTLTKEGIIK